MADQENSQGEMVLPPVEKKMRREEIQAGLRPFQLVKYFSFTSLGVILVFTLILSWVISNHARKIMLEQSEEYSLLLAENLNQQVFRSFVLPTVVRFGKIALSHPDQFEMLDRIVKNATQGLKTESVTIYDSSINIISYSTRPELVGKKDVGGVEYQKALKNNPISQIVFSGSLWSLMPGAPSVQCQLKTYIPFRQVSNSGAASPQIMGVIEITQDLSKEYGAIIELQGRIILVSSIIMAVLFIVLRTIVSRGDRLMEIRATERLRLEEKLNQSERLAHLGTMVATVSHEIKSPLGIIRSTAELLEKRIKKVAPGNEQLARIIVDETTRLNNIVMEFLDFARPQEPKLSRVDVNTVVRKALQFIEPSAREKKIELRAELEPVLAPIALDQEMFYRALLNILVNGLQAMDDQGVLQVSTTKGEAAGSSIAMDSQVIQEPGVVQEQPTGVVKIIVRDNGKGMSAEKVEQIFKPFFSDKNRGTGLGLAISRNIIEHHHGSIGVESKEGEGTTFTIILPAV
ncbi:MAG: ATP-binding protein [Desulfocapsaceae bacterium]|nr:ATP-binding protein [Desulfocapsaceae bacterium]